MVDAVVVEEAIEANQTLDEALLDYQKSAKDYGAGVDLLWKSVIDLKKEIRKGRTRGQNEQVENVAINEEHNPQEAMQNMDEENRDVAQENQHEVEHIEDTEENDNSNPEETSEDLMARMSEKTRQKYLEFREGIDRVRHLFNRQDNKEHDEQEVTNEADTVEKLKKFFAIYLSHPSEAPQNGRVKVVGKKTFLEMLVVYSFPKTLISNTLAINVASTFCSENNLTFRPIGHDLADFEFLNQEGDNRRIEAGDAEAQTNGILWTLLNDPFARMATPDSSDDEEEDEDDEYQDEDQDDENEGNDEEDG